MTGDRSTALPKGFLSAWKGGLRWPVLGQVVALPSVALRWGTGALSSPARGGRPQPDPWGWGPRASLSPWAPYLGLWGPWGGLLSCPLSSPGDLTRVSELAFGGQLVSLMEAAMASLALGSPWQHLPPGSCRGSQKPQQGLPPAPWES